MFCDIEEGNFDKHDEYEETDSFSTVCISADGDCGCADAVERSFIRWTSGLAGFIVLLIIDIFLYLYDKYISKEKVFASVLQIPIPLKKY